MPSPVTTARQCLTDEAARALDDAVAVARRRSHSQTTSLHAVSALLALPSSSLRDACFRSRSSSDYPPRLQFRALELCVGVSLDRLPSSKSAAEPMISNALMAAIKRSQANQRRHPDSFHLQQIHFSNNQAPTVIKVELKHFIGSILDDPVVSRVFGEAGFISYEIKSVILSPPLLLRNPRFPPAGLFHSSSSLFSRNLGSGFGFPFSDDGAENCRRIGEVMVKSDGKGKNPLLLGACASDALKRFVDRLKNNSTNSLPSEIAGISVFVVEFEEKEKLGQKFDELGRVLEACSGRGIVASFGDLESLIGDDNDDDSSSTGSYMVSKLTEFLERFKEKLWLIGAAASYDVYSKFLKRFHSVEKDWDLQLLPITSSSSSISKSSLLGSFVPFGGFFPTSSELPSPLSSMNEQFLRCNLCTAKYEQEVAALLKTRSSADNLPSWLKMAEQNKGKGVDSASKIEDDCSTLALQKKWNDVCHRIHRSKFDNGSKDSSLDPSPSTSVGVFDLSGVRRMQVVSEPKNVNSHLDVVGEEEEEESIMHLQAASVRTDCTSSSSSSVTTDLGLGTLYSTCPMKSLDHKEQCDHLSSTNSTEIDASASDSNLSRQVVKSSPPRVPFDLADFKRLRTLLSRKVSWQDSAVSAICQALLNCRLRGSKSRNDIWLSFLGPDKIGKRKIASALAEIVTGTHENLILVDLSCHQHEAGSMNFVFQHREFYNDVNFRGKTVVDYIAAEMKKKPRSVILLENVDQADFMTRASLSQAVSKGKFADSHGRELSTNNMIFITTSTSSSMDPASENRTYKYTEELILGAKRWQMQMLVEPVSQIAGMKVKVLQNSSSCSSSSTKKRKLQESNEPTKRPRGFLDLNLPVEEETEDELDDSISDNTAWTRDFFNQVDEMVEFKPFDFDALGEKIVKAITFQIEKLFGSEKVSLEIDDDAMLQMIAASWSSENEESMTKWVENVLGRVLSELRYNAAKVVPYAMKLVSCVGVSVSAEELAPGICLPSRINL